MTQVFISYKREDQLRVTRLVQALQHSGLSLKWDRDLPAGANWRTQIESALNQANCVVAIWTHHSISPAGDFVRDEAAHAKRRGILVPVLLDKVEPPLGFREIQAIDLTHWRGSRRDPFFQDLLAAITAKIEGRPVPPPKGPFQRLRRRLTYGSLASAALFAGLAFSLNAFHAQDTICAITLSDTCGALGLGNRPTQTERLAWAARKPGSCADLRTHIARFPSGAYRLEATSLLNARNVTQSEHWTHATRRLALYEPQDTRPSPTRAAAEAAARTRAQIQAESLCKSFAATASYRYKSATPDAQHWECSPLEHGFTCAVQGEAVCALDDRDLQEQEICGR